MIITPNDERETTPTHLQANQPSKNYSMYIQQYIHGLQTGIQSEVEILHPMPLCKAKPLLEPGAIGHLVRKLIHVEFLHGQGTLAQDTVDNGASADIARPESIEYDVGRWWSKSTATARRGCLS